MGELRVRTFRLTANQTSPLQKIIPQPQPKTKPLGQRPPTPLPPPPPFSMMMASLGEQCIRWHMPKASNQHPQSHEMSIHCRYANSRLS